MMRLPIFLFLSLATLWGCRSTNNDSDVKITNGRRAQSNEFPAVVQITTIQSQFSAGNCTGTFVSDTTIVTAAHCVTDSSRNIEKNIRIGGFTGVKALLVFANPDYIQRPTSGNDVAIVVFEKGTSKNFKNIHTTEPTVGDEITLVASETIITLQERVLVQSESEKTYYDQIIQVF